MEMSRIRIEGLLAAFPKLIGSGKQHTYVETENVRYIYQPMEVRGAWQFPSGCPPLLWWPPGQPCSRAGRALHPQALYLLLITNKASNILEDLETLRMLSKLVPEYSPMLDEESVASKAYEVVFAFDEVISLGHKENITVQQVKQVRPGCSNCRRRGMPLWAPGAWEACLAPQRPVTSRPWPRLCNAPVAWLLACRIARWSLTRRSCTK